MDSILNELIKVSNPLYGGLDTFINSETPHLQVNIKN